MSATLVVTRVEASDTLDDGHDLVVHERRPAADTVPAQQDLRHHRCVHPVAEQMPGQRGDRFIPFTLRDAFSDEPPPMPDRMPEAPRFHDSLAKHPVRQRRQLRQFRRPRSLLRVLRRGADRRRG